LNSVTIEILSSKLFVLSLSSGYCGRQTQLLSFTSASLLQVFEQPRSCSDYPTAKYKSQNVFTYQKQQQKIKI